jgi:hypothetical protein
MKSTFHTHTAILVALILASLPRCSSQRSFLSAGTKLLDKNNSSANNSDKRKKTPFFGAAAAELIVDNESSSSDGESHTIFGVISAGLLGLIAILLPVIMREQESMDADENRKNTKDQKAYNYSISSEIGKLQKG